MQVLGALTGEAESRPVDAWPDDDVDGWPPDPAVADDPARVWAECNSDLARHLASMPEPPDSGWAPPVTVQEFAERALLDGPDAAAAALAAAEPGPRAAVLLAMLDPARLAPASMIGVIAATEKLASWTQAMQHRWLAAFTVPGVAASRSGLLAYASAPGQPLHRPPTVSGTGSDAGAGPGGSGGSEIAGGGDLAWSGPAVHGDAELDRIVDQAVFKVAVAEVSAALHFSPLTAQRRVRQALDFTTDLPGTLQALAGGRIDRGRALTILDRTENLPADLRRRVETAVLDKAVSRTPGQLRGIVDRAVICVDPAAAKKRQAKARAERGVSVRPERDGMSAFLAELPAEHAGVAFSVLDRVATTLHRRSDEDRRIGALRADVFSDIFDQLATQGAIDLRATIGHRAVIDHGPLTCSWITDPTTIAARFDPDTLLRDPTMDHPAADPTTTTAPDTDPHTDRNGDPACPVGAAPQTSAPDTAAADVQSPDVQSPDVHSADVHSAVRNACDESVDQRAKPVTDQPDQPAKPATDQPDQPEHPEHPEHPGRLSTDKPEKPSTRRRPAGERVGTPDHGPSAGERHGAAPDSFRPFVFPTQQGRHTHLNVTIAASTLAGLDDLPGELDGHGPIPADICRALALSAASITAIAVDPTCGNALDLGRTTYRPRLSQRDHVTQRDRTCRFPGCRQPARRCQIDHSEEFCPGRLDGGTTCPCNLACLCKFHHDLKSTGLWDAHQHPDASITWTSPTGCKYTTRPPEWPIDRPHPPTPGSRTANTTGHPKDQPGQSLSQTATAATATGDDEPPF